MPTPVIMPKFGMTQTEGTVMRWLKGEGDTVAKGDVLLEVQTDKVDMEVEAPASGVLHDIRVTANVTVPVATVIAQVFAPGETASTTLSPLPANTPVVLAAPSANKATPVAQRIAEQAGLALTTVSGSGPGGRVTKADVALALYATPPAALNADPSTTRARATPAARRFAKEANLALHDLVGSGPNGRIQAADVAQQVQAARAALATASAAEVAPPQGVPLQGMRKTIATRLTQSWQQIPHITLTMSVDMTQAEALRQRLGSAVEQKNGARLTPTVLIAKAVASALTQHPRLNAWLLAQDQELHLVEHAVVNLGIAVALEDGLIVPVIKAAQTQGLAGLAEATSTAGRSARQRTLRPADLADGTFTISNLGMHPIDHFTALINPPQVAILAVGQIQIKPLWDGQAFQPTAVAELTLSADHRAVDGAVAAAFLAELKQLLEEPTRLLL